MVAGSGVDAVVTGMGRALPAPMEQQALWDGYFARHYQGVRIAGRLFAGAGVHTRHGVVNPCDEDVSGWGTGARMERYLAEAMPLGKDAVATALENAGLDAADVGLFAVVSCTGYVTPGIDIRLARDLGMSDEVQRLVVGHMGCYAAIPGLGSAADFVTARGRPAVLLCLELPSLHVQPPTPEIDQVIAHALFGDAAAAVVVQPAGSAAPARPVEPVEPGGPGEPVGPVGPAGPGRPVGLTVLDVVARTDVTTADHMTWDVTDLGFRMGLSPRVPAVLARHVEAVIRRLLARNGVDQSDVDGWAVHPGGTRILEVVADRLGLPAGALAASYGVLHDYGNCSSATVLLVLDRLRAAGGVRPGRYAVAMAFGPGLTLYAALLRAAADSA